MKEKKYGIKRDKKTRRCTAVLLNPYKGKPERKYGKLKNIKSVAENKLRPLIEKKEENKKKSTVNVTIKKIKKGKKNKK